MNGDFHEAPEAESTFCKRCEECGEFITEGYLCAECAAEDAAVERRVNEALEDPDYDPNEPWSDRAEQEINAREDRRYDEQEQV
jgi:anaerobic ribonucleoside-triphosphate reductase